MSSSAQSLDMKPKARRQRSGGITATGWRLALIPSLVDCLFICLIVWMFIVTGSGKGWDMLLSDGDTGWHIRVGESILETGVIPATDSFSFTRPGEAWYAWEWLSEIGLALVHGALGLKGVTLAAGVMIAMFAMMLLRLMLWKGANAFVAFFVLLLAVGGATVHYLARPHLFTFLFLIVSIWLVERDRRSPDRWIWILVPLTALWTNLHGGFPVLFVCLGTVVAGSVIEGLLEPSHRREKFRMGAKYAGLGVACLAASVLNPFGIELHRHIIAYLRSDWIKTAVNEFQSPSFRAENILQYEVLLLLGVAVAGWLLLRRRIVEALWILIWAHFSLSAARHIPIYVIFAGPIIAMELTRLWDRMSATAKPSSVTGILDRLGRDLNPGFRRLSVWPLLFVAFLVFERGIVRWPQDFPDWEFPTAIIHRHSEKLTTARIFTDDQWADYLIYLNYPDQKVFMDGRTDFYGQEVGDKYLAVLYAKPEWEEILKEYKIDLVLTPPSKPLATVLAMTDGWEQIDGDEDALLYAPVGSKYLLPDTGD
jgi:hypothetical protein